MVVPLPRARRFAAASRIVLAASGMVVVVLADLPRPSAALVGLAVLALSGVLVGWGGPLLQAADGWLSVPIAVLLVGVQGGAVSPMTAVWVASVGCGALARQNGPRADHVFAVAAAMVACAAVMGRLPVDLAGLATSMLVLVAVCARIGQASREEARRAGHAAAHDYLTGALSHSAFRQQFERQLAHREPFGLLLIDLDNFGTVNRRAGHLAGDRVLAAACSRMSRAAGPSAVVGRLGGDEFGVLMPVSEAEAAAHRIVSAFTREPLVGHAVGASVGMALHPDDGVEWEPMVAAADLALRGVKGRGKAAVARARPEKLRPHRDLARDVRALWQEGRIEMWVQPIVDAAAGAVHGHEALARIDGKPPGSWFGLADAVGLRLDLERECLRLSLDLFAERPQGTSLSVNMSAVGLGLPEVRNLLLDRGDLHGLVIELTEEDLLSEAPGLRESLEAVRAAGALVALDDMGTGQASLRHLAELRPDYIKLDRSVVSGLHVDAARAALVDALVGYAERTGARVVAEGVEEHAELECLVALQTPLVQGYLTGRPAPPWPPFVRQAVAARELDASIAEIRAPTTTEELRRRFEAQPTLVAAVVVGPEAQVLGLVTRDRLLQTLGRQFGHALYAGRSVLAIADRRCLVVPDAAPEEVLVKRAVTRPLGTRNDPIVLHDGAGRLSGVLTMTDLLQSSLRVAVKG